MPEWGTVCSLKVEKQKFRFCLFDALLVKQQNKNKKYKNVNSFSI